MSLTRYFLCFFLFCFIFTCICGVLAALLPTGMGGILTIVTYLMAIILVLYKFLKQQHRAPTDQERKKITLGFTLIFWGYNVFFLLVRLLIFAKNDPDIRQNFLLYIKNPQFMRVVLTMFLLITIPLYILTYWFYGKQAHRMSDKMFG